MQRPLMQPSAPMVSGPQGRDGARCRRRGAGQSRRWDAAELEGAWDAEAAAAVKPDVVALGGVAAAAAVPMAATGADGKADTAREAACCRTARWNELPAGASWPANAACHPVHPSAAQAATVDVAAVAAAVVYQHAAAAEDTADSDGMDEAVGKRPFELVASPQDEKEVRIAARPPVLRPLHLLVAVPV